MAHIGSADAARLKFLNESAHLLHSAAPASASFIQAEYDRWLDNHGIHLTASRHRQVCGACGHDLLSETSVSQILLRERRPANRTMVTGTTMTIECGRCHSRTRIVREQKTDRQRAPPQEATIVKITKAQSMQPTLPYAGSNHQEPIANLKRGKHRKQVRLQTQLARSRQQESSGKMNAGFGLDLMDFMKAP